MSNRKPLSTKSRNKVLSEFNHLCAICGKPNPHIHHVDGNCTNNILENLLPLCPNHHLLDAHNPTVPTASGKLALFRQYRDPAILLTQFDPLFNRMKFLLPPEIVENDLHVLQSQCHDLLDFVKHLKMGSYYESALFPLIGWRQPSLSNAGSMVVIEREEQAGRLYLKKLISQREKIILLLVECLRFQEWKSIATYSDA